MEFPLFVDASDANEFIGINFVQCCKIVRPGAPVCVLTNIEGDECVTAIYFGSSGFFVDDRNAIAQCLRQKGRLAVSVANCKFATLTANLQINAF